MQASSHRMVRFVLFPLGCIFYSFYSYAQPSWPVDVPYNPPPTKIEVEDVRFRAITGIRALNELAASGTDVDPLVETKVEIKKVEYFSRREARWTQVPDCQPAEKPDEICRVRPPQHAVVRDQYIFAVGDPFVFNDFYRFNASMNYLNQPGFGEHTQAEVRIHTTTDHRPDKNSGVYGRARIRQSEFQSFLDPNFDIEAEVDITVDTLRRPDFRAHFGIYASYDIGFMRFWIGPAIRAEADHELQHGHRGDVPIQAGAETNRLNLGRLGPIDTSAGARGTYENVPYGYQGQDAFSDGRAVGSMDLRLKFTDAIGLRFQYMGHWKENHRHDQHETDHELFVDLEYLVKGSPKAVW